MSSIARVACKCLNVPRYACLALENWLFLIRVFSSSVHSDFEHMEDFIGFTLREFGGVKIIAVHKDGCVTRAMLLFWDCAWGFGLTLSIHIDFSMAIWNSLLPDQYCGQWPAWLTRGVPAVVDAIQGSSHGWGSSSGIAWWQSPVLDSTTCVSIVDIVEINIVAIQKCGQMIQWPKRIVGEREGNVDINFSKTLSNRTGHGNPAAWNSRNSWEQFWDKL